MSPSLRFGLWYAFRNPAQWQKPYPELYRAVFDQIASLASQGTAVLLITHDAALAAQADRQITIVDGSIVMDTRVRP